MLRHRRAALALVVWTLLVWATRFNLIWNDADLGTGGKLARSTLAASFTILAVVVGAGLWRQRHPGGITTSLRAVGLLAGWTTGVWLVRGTGIIVGDHSVGFTLVHTALAIVSIALAILAWREATARRHTAQAVHETAGT